MARTRSVSAIARATVAQPAKIDNDLYVRDYSKCVLCYKCVEACGVDAQNTFAIAVAGRGFTAHIATEYDVPLPDSACVYCGNCIGVCPTGALMFKSEYDMRQAGTWNESRQTQTDTICPYCGVGCDLTVHAQDGRNRARDFAARSQRDSRQSLHQGPLRLAVCADSREGARCCSVSRLARSRKEIIPPGATGKLQSSAARRSSRQKSAKQRGNSSNIQARQLAGDPQIHHCREIGAASPSST